MRPQMSCCWDNTHNKHACIRIMRTYACCVTAYLRALLTSPFILESLLIVLCVALILRLAGLDSVVNATVA